MLKNGRRKKYLRILVFFIISCFTFQGAARAWGMEFGPGQWEIVSEGTDEAVYEVYTQTAAGDPVWADSITCHVESTWTSQPASDFIEVHLKNTYGEDVYRGFVINATDSDDNELRDTGAISESIYLFGGAYVDAVEIKLHAPGAYPTLDTNLSTVTLDNHVTNYHVESTQGIASNSDISWGYTPSSGQVAVGKAFVKSHADSMKSWNDDWSDVYFYNYREFTAPSDNTAEIIFLSLGYSGVYDSAATDITYIGPIAINSSKYAYGFAIDAGLSYGLPGEAGSSPVVKHTLCSDWKDYCVEWEVTDALIETGLQFVPDTITTPLYVYETIQWGSEELGIDGVIIGGGKVHFRDVLLYEGQRYSPYIGLRAGTAAGAQGALAHAWCYVNFQDWHLGLSPTAELFMKLSTVLSGYGSDKDYNELIPLGLILSDVLIVYRPEPFPMIEVESPVNGLHCMEDDAVHFKFHVFNGQPTYAVSVNSDIDGSLFAQGGIADNNDIEFDYYPSKKEVDGDLTITDHKITFIAGGVNNSHRDFSLHVIPYPQAVDNLEFLDPNSGHDWLTFHWDSNEQDTFEGYEFWVSEIDDFVSSEAAQIRFSDSQGGFTYLEDNFTTNRNMTTCQVYGLQPETTYYFWIVVKDRWGNTAVTESSVEGMTHSYPPLNPVYFQLPADPNVDTKTLSTVRLFWTESERPEYPEACYSDTQDYSFACYEIYREDGPDNWVKVSPVFIPGQATLQGVDTITTRGTTECTVAGLEPATTYYFKVYVYDNAGNCAESNETSKTTEAPSYPLEVEIEPSQVVFIDEPANLTAKAWGGTGPYEFRWDFDASDGVDFDNPDAASEKVWEHSISHQYSEYGRYEVRLKVIDDVNDVVVYPQTGTWCFVRVIPHPPELSQVTFIHWSAEDRYAPSKRPYTVDPLTWCGWSSGFSGDNFHNFNSYDVWYKKHESPYGWAPWETAYDPNHCNCSSALDGLEADTLYDFRVEVVVDDFAGGSIGSQSDILTILTDRERVDLAFESLYIDGTEVMQDGTFVWDPEVALGLVKGYGEEVEIEFQIRNWGETQVESYEPLKPPVTSWCYHHHPYNPGSEFYEQIGFSDVNSLEGLEPFQVTEPTTFKWQPEQICMGLNTLSMTIEGPFEGLMRNLAFEDYGVCYSVSLNLTLNIIFDNTPPESITDLQVVDANDTTITLNWTSPLDYDDGGFSMEDPNIYTGAKYIPPYEPNLSVGIEPVEKSIDWYDIRYSSEMEDGAEWLFANGSQHVYVPPTQHLGEETESCTIENLEPDTTYYFVVKPVDLAGNTGKGYSNIAEGNTVCNRVNLENFEQFAAQWLKSGGGLSADLDGDNNVDIVDLSLFVQQWQECVPPGWSL